MIIVSGSVKWNSFGDNTLWNNAESRFNHSKGVSMRGLGVTIYFEKYLKTSNSSIIITLPRLLLFLSSHPSNNKYVNYKQ